VKILLDVFTGLLAIIATIATINQLYVPAQTVFGEVVGLRTILRYMPWNFYLIAAALAFIITIYIRKTSIFCNPNESDLAKPESHAEEYVVTDLQFANEMQQWKKKWRFSKLHRAVAACLGSQYASSDLCPKCSPIHAAGMILQNENDNTVLAKTACWVKNQLSNRNSTLLSPVYLLAFLAKSLENQIDRKKQTFEPFGEYTATKKHLCYAYTTVARKVSELLNDIALKNSIMHCVQENKDQIKQFMPPPSLQYACNISYDLAYTELRSLLESMLNKIHIWIENSAILAVIDDIVITSVLPVLFDIRTNVNNEYQMTAMLQAQAEKIALVLIPQWNVRGRTEWYNRVSNATQEEVIAKLLPWLTTESSINICNLAIEIITNSYSQSPHEFEQSQAISAYDAVGDMVVQIVKDKKTIDRAATNQIIEKFQKISVLPHNQNMQTKKESIIRKLRDIAGSK
jgi:hypothetical protein